MRRCDIRFLNLLALLEKEGYGLCDSIYYVEAEGEGLNGLELVDSNFKVEKMVRKYDRSKKLVLTVMRDKRNQAIIVSPAKNKEADKIFARSYPCHTSFDLEEEDHCQDLLQT